MFFLVFFLFNPPRLECSRIRKTALFLMSHRLKICKNLHLLSFKIGAKAWSMLKNRNFLKAKFIA